MSLKGGAAPGAKLTVHSPGRPKGIGRSPGNHVVRVGFKYDGGGAGKGGEATLYVDGNQVAMGHIPQRIRTRFSLDEAFDVGEDTGTPVSEEYAAKMPYAFNGVLKKVVGVLEPQKLSPEEMQRLRQEEGKGSTVGQ